MRRLAFPFGPQTATDSLVRAADPGEGLDKDLPSASVIRGWDETDEPISPPKKADDVKQFTLPVCCLKYSSGRL